MMTQRYDSRDLIRKAKFEFIVEEKNHDKSKDRQEKEFQSFGQEQTFEKMCVKQIAKCEMDKERVFSAKNLSKSEDIPPDENITENPSLVTAKVKAQPKKKIISTTNSTTTSGASKPKK